MDDMDNNGWSEENAKIPKLPKICNCLYILLFSSRKKYGHSKCKNTQKRNLDKSINSTLFLNQKNQQSHKESNQCGDESYEGDIGHTLYSIIF